MSDLEKDFEDVAAQINRKITEATAALKEVNRLREEAKLPSLISSVWVIEDMDEDKRDEFIQKLDMLNVSDLENELCEAGWSTSSSYC